MRQFGMMAQQKLNTISWGSAMRCLRVNAEIAAASKAAAA